jgi:hypothetical protein
MGGLDVRLVGEEELESEGYSAKLLSNFCIQASASGMIGESVSMGYDRTGGWREVRRGSQSRKRGSKIFRKALCAHWLAWVPYYLQSTKREYSSVRATLRSGPEGPILARENQS